MGMLNNISLFEQGDLVIHRGNSSFYKNVGIVIDVKPLTTGYDIQVLWPEGRIANHHSNALEYLCK